MRRVYAGENNKARHLVSVTGIEPTASGPQIQCSAKLSYTDVFSCFIIFTQRLLKCPPPFFRYPGGTKRASKAIHPLYHPYTPPIPPLYHPIGVSTEAEAEAEAEELLLSSAGGKSFVPGGQQQQCLIIYKY